jgi:hypothetical protein
MTLGMRSPERASTLCGVNPGRISPMHVEAAREPGFDC